MILTYEKIIFYYLSKSEIRVILNFQMSIQCKIMFFSIKFQFWPHFFRFLGTMNLPSLKQFGQTGAAATQPTGLFGQFFGKVQDPVYTKSKPSTSTAQTSDDKKQLKHQDTRNEALEALRKGPQGSGGDAVQEKIF